MMENPNVSEWLAVGKSLSRQREASAFLLGDWINDGVETYGKVAAYDYAEKVIRRARCSLYLFAHVARAFAPERRVPDLSFQHHAVLAKFPPAIVDELLAEAIERGLTCKQVRTAAEERCGVQKANGRRKKVVISLAEQTIADLKELAPGKKVNWTVVGIVEDFLRTKGFAVPERLTTAERRERWQASGKCIFCGTNPADEGNRACGDCRQKNADRQKKAPEPVKAAEPVPEQPQPTQASVAPSLGVPAVDGEDKAPRPSYAERRKQQIAAGAPPIPPRLHKFSTRPKKEAVRIAWVDCEPRTYVESNEGEVRQLSKGPQPTNFKTEEDAMKANELFKESHGYAEQIEFCRVHSAFHLRHKIWARDLLSEQAAVAV